MGICTYCGQSAGFLRSKHKECEEKYHKGWADMTELARNAVIGKVGLDTIYTKLSDIAKINYMSEDKIRLALTNGWENAVDVFLEDGLLNAEEESKLTSFAEKFSFGQSDLDSKGKYTGVVKAGVIRDLTEGKIPKRINLSGQLPFNLQKTENLVWVFPSVSYYEDKTRRGFVGSTQGVSVRIAKGVYYRVGAFKGHPVETTERVHIGNGLLGVTNKQIYFVGGLKSLRVKYDKIISYIPFDDGIGIHRDASSAKPQVFVTGDGWFTYNLIMNAQNI
jgi:hypothetical protein